MPTALERINFVVVQKETEHVVAVVVVVVIVVVIIVVVVVEEVLSGLKGASPQSMIAHT